MIKSDEIKSDEIQTGWNQNCGWMFHFVKSGIDGRKDTQQELYNDRLKCENRFSAFDFEFE